VSDPQDDATTPPPRPTVAPDVAQWRQIFARVDALLTAGEPPAAAAADGVVDAVVRDWQQRTQALDIDAGAGAVAQAVLGKAAAPAVASGQRCGNYRLLEPIGQGGMGSVWRGERIDGLYRSQVAIKLLGSLALSAQARARFAHEGELLARLAHPNIARLLDAGLTDDSQRFLVLELVDGQDIVAHVRALGLRAQGVATLFRQVLAAVAYAHGQLVVHRDIKPGNVMVTRDGSVKLLDFGVGKLLAEAEQATAAGDLTRVVGAAYTEAYAAPEQLRGDPVSTAFDVFALGTLLFELLAGERPQWATGKRYLHDDTPAQNLALVHDADLRAIVARALAIEPAERYGSVAAFDDDVARYLAGEPVRAHASSRWYRAGKLWRRHRWPLTGAALAAGAVLASLGFALWQLQEAREQRAQALSQAARANQVTAFLTGIFRASDLRTPTTQDRQSLTALQLLDAGRERLAHELDDQPEAKVALLGVLAEVYGFMGDSPRFDALNSERIRLARERLGERHPETLLARFLDAEADLYSGNFEAGRKTLAALDEPFRQAFGAGSARYANLLATAAELERRAGEEPPERMLRRYERPLALFAALGERSEEHATALQNYSSALALAGRLEDSLLASERAIAMFSGLRNYDVGALAISLERRADTLQRLGRHDQVEALLDQSIKLIADTYGTQAAVYKTTVLAKVRWLHGQQRRAEAWALFDAVRALPAPAVGDTLAVNELEFARGQLLLAENRLPEAIAALGRAVDGWREANNNPVRLKRAEALLATARAQLGAGAGATR